MWRKEHTRTRMKEEIGRKKGRRDDGKERCVGNLTEETMEGHRTAEKEAESGRGNHGTA